MSVLHLESARAVARRARAAARQLLISDRAYAKRRFQETFKYSLNLKHPRTFSEKIQWYKLYARDRTMVRLADKAAARDYVAARIGSQYLTKCFGVFSNSQQISAESLPSAFALKATHGSGWNILVPDATKCDWAVIKSQLRQWLGTDYYYQGREWVYKHVPRRIICEEYLWPPAGQSLWDYKFFCFDGVPRFIQVDVDRHTRHTRAFFDMSWSKCPFGLEYPNCDHVLKRPACLDEMASVARALAKGFPFVRVDLYEVEKRVVFGELTFYPGNGFERFSPAGADQDIGGLFTLPIQSRG